MVRLDPVDITFTAEDGEQRKVGEINFQPIPGEAETARNVAYEQGFAEGIEVARRVEHAEKQEADLKAMWHKAGEEDACGKCSALRQQLDEVRKELDHRTGRLERSFAAEEEWAKLAESLQRVLRFKLADLG